jgi:RNA polymerase-binding transcription factor DksA
MLKQEQDKYRELLLQQGRRLQWDMFKVQGEALRGTGAEPSGTFSNTPVHPADLSSDLYEQEVAVGLLANEKQILEEIAAALGRIAAGRYGRCLRCGRDIPESRLQVVPYVAYCVDCADQHEKDEPPGQVTDAP